MNRRQAREYAFKLIYESGVQTDKTVEELISDTAQVHEFEPDAYITKVVYGVKEKNGELGELIAECASGWKLERLSLASLSIMKLATYEMLYVDDIPFSVSINEAVELAKLYDHDKAPKFINGILNAIAVKKGLKGTAQTGSERK